VGGEPTAVDSDDAGERRPAALAGADSAANSSAVAATGLMLQRLPP